MKYFGNKIWQLARQVRLDLTQFQFEIWNRSGIGIGKIGTRIEKIVIGTSFSVSVQESELESKLREVGSGSDTSFHGSFHRTDRFELD